MPGREQRPRCNVPGHRTKGPGRTLRSLIELETEVGSKDDDVDRFCPSAQVEASPFGSLGDTCRVGRRQTNQDLARVGGRGQPRSGIDCIAQRREVGHILVPDGTDERDAGVDADARLGSIRCWRSRARSPGAARWMRRWPWMRDHRLTYRARTGRQPRHRRTCRRSPRARLAPVSRPRRSGSGDRRSPTPTSARRDLSSRARPRTACSARFRAAMVRIDVLVAATAVSRVLLPRA